MSPRNMIIFCLTSGLFFPVLSPFASAAENTVEINDCHVLFEKEASLSDKINALKNQEKEPLTQDQKTGKDQFYIKFDPVPGFGIMEGVTLTPGSQHTGETERNNALARLQKDLTRVQKDAARKSCARGDATGKRREGL